MKTRFSLMGLGFILLLAACVTINIYFPAAAAEKVADKIIDEIQGPITESEQPLPGTEPGTDKKILDESDPLSYQQSSQWQQLADNVISIFISSAAAEADLNADSPAVRKIRASMSARFGALKPMYAQGFIGIQSNGMLIVRNAGSIPLAKRSQVNQLVAAENKDRSALYQAIASANGHPEWATQIQQTFARRWIAKAQGGWWVNNGGWKQK